MDHVYRATIRWERGDQPFTDGRYSRGHVLAFDGLEVPGSSSPFSVRVPLSREDAVDPEEGLVASASSCHMLFFLDFARRAGFRVDRYEDAATGEMGPNEAGKLYVARVTLNPAVTFSGAKTPTQAEYDTLHHRTHEECYIGHSIRAEMVIRPTFTLI